MANLTCIADLADPLTLQQMIRVTHLRGRALTWGEIDRFAELGIGVHRLQEPWPVFADRVVFADKTFHFARDTGEDGELAFTLAVLSDDGFVDIVAWHPRTGRQAIWLGNGFALGERQINYPDPQAKGLLIHRSPMSWLRAGRSGIVILRDDFAAQLLARVPILIAEDSVHQRELQAFFPYQYFDPRIEVREPATEISRSRSA